MPATIRTSLEMLSKYIAAG